MHASILSVRDTQYICRSILCHSAARTVSAACLLSYTQTTKSVCSTQNMYVIFHMNRSYFMHEKNKKVCTPSQCNSEPV